MSEIVLKTSNLTKDYGKGRGIFDVNLEVKRGEVYGFIGTNGSGKTTTIRNMMGFIAPDSGSSVVNGMDSWKQSAEIMQNVSYVPGEIAFPALATGTDFLKLQAEYLRVTDFTYMNHVIELLQLDPTANLKRMSKGMKQKTAIVAALMGEKEVLVLDEPTTGLDPLMRDAFLELIREEKAKGHTVFMLSHIFEEIEEVCDTVAMIKDGHILDVRSLYALRHPKNKCFVVTFESCEECERFAAAWRNQMMVNVQENRQTQEDRQVQTGRGCEVELPVEQMDAFIGILKNFVVIDFKERHLTLQKHFMNTYKKEGTGNEK